MGHQKPGEFYRHMQSLAGGILYWCNRRFITKSKTLVKKTSFWISNNIGKNNIADQQELSDRIWNGLHS